MNISNFAFNVEQCIDKHSLLNKHSKVLVCISGGADSVALLLALCELGYDCVAAHCNFGLRGEESDADEQFVADLCNRLHVPLKRIRFDVDAYKAEHRGISIEMACRDLRYAWFREIAAAEGLTAIAIAHNSNDRVETLLLNILRGTGIKGLASIRIKNGNIVRPLLNTNRDEILEYLNTQKQPYRTDSTNNEDIYRRNKVRNRLLPMIRELFPDSAIERTLANLDSASEFYDFAIRQYTSTLLKPSESGVFEIPAESLLNIPGNSTLLHEIFAPYGFNSDQTGSMLQATAGASFESASHILYICPGRMILQEKALADIPESYSFVPLSSEHIPAILKIETAVYKSGFQFEKGNRKLYLHASALGNMMTLRHYRTGDTMQPFGMGGRKRLVSNIFSDAKLGIPEKKAQWILECDGKILWLPGLKASCHFPVKEDDTMAIISLQE